MKVLVIPSNYPSVDMPTKFIFVQEQVIALSKLGLEQTIIFPENRSVANISANLIRHNYFQHSHAIENNIPIYRKHSWNIIPTKYMLGSKIWSELAYKMAKQYITLKGKPDVIHAHCSDYAGLVALKLYKKYSIPYIITEHSPFRNSKYISNARMSLYKHIYDNASKIIAVSSSHEKYINNFFHNKLNKILVVPNFVDTNFFSPVLNITNKNENIFNILAVNNLNNDKRVDRLLYAFDKAFKDDLNVTLTIAGEGHLSDNLKMLAHRLNLQSKVRFVGRTIREQVKEYISQSDTLVLASDRETFGMVLIEALSMGKPVISTNSGGPADIINKSVGLLCDNTIDALADALIYMRANHVSYSSEYLHNYIENKFSDKVVCSKIIDIYRSMLLN